MVDLLFEASPQQATGNVLALLVQIEGRKKN